MPVPGTASLDSSEKYTGQRYDEETSLYYYGARYYDPGLGRFIGADAVIASQYRTSALHPYAYVESNPVNYVDPSGNLAVPGVGGGGAGWNRPDRGGGADIAAGLAGLLQGAIDRTIAQFSAGPEVAPAGPERSVQPGQGFQAGTASQESSPDNVYSIPESVRDALEGILGDGSTEGVEVIHRPWYVRAHLIFLGSLRGQGSVTRPERIFTNIPEEEFFKADRHVLHEFYHVVEQWREQDMSRTDYLRNAGEREAAAEGFASENLDRYRKLLGKPR